MALDQDPSQRRNVIDLSTLSDVTLKELYNAAGEVTGKLSDHRMAHGCNGHDCNTEEGQELDRAEREAHGIKNAIRIEQFSEERLSR